MARSSYEIQQWVDTHLPDRAVDLFGHEVSDDTPQKTKAVIAATDVGGDGEWGGGVYMLLEPGGPASIRQLVIVPASRGQGLAGRLLRRAGEIAKDHGCAELRSTAGFGCGDHLALYRRLGFSPAPPEQRPYLVTKAVGNRSNR